MRRPSLSTGAYLLLVFLSGAVVGVFGNRLYEMRSVNANGNARNSVEYRKRYIEELRSRLHLSDDQVSKLQPVLDETHRRVHEVLDPHRLEIKAIEDDQARKVSALLNPDQQTEFEKMRQERERHRQMMESHPR